MPDVYAHTFEEKEGREMVKEERRATGGKGEGICMPPACVSFLHLFLQSPCNIYVFSSIFGAACLSNSMAMPCTFHCAAALSSFPWQWLALAWLCAFYMAGALRNFALAL